AINLQLAAHGATEFRFRQHAFYGEFDHQFRTTLESLHELFFAKSAREAGVVSINFRLRLQPGQLDLSGIDDDDVITGIHEGRVAGVVFAGKDTRDTGSKAAQSLA